MTFERYWPLVLLIAIPVIIIMYLLKQKMEDYKVPSLFLWKEMYRNKEADRPWEKLKHNILMVLQILFVLLLVFALMGPGLTLGDSQNKNAVIIIDNSASMNTVIEGNRTRLQLAKDHAAELVRTYSDDTAFTVIVCSDKANMLVSNTGDKLAVINKIRSIEETWVSGDCSAAVTMAEGMAAADASVVVFTDTGVSFKNLTGKIYDLSGAPENLSVDYVTGGRRNDGLVVIAGVTNHTKEDITSDINVYGDGKIIYIANETIAAGETKNLFYDGLDFDGQSLAVEINEKDDLKADNIRYYVIDTINAEKVLLVTDQNLYLEKAVALNKGIELFKTADTEGFDSFASEGYGLYIFDGKLPDVMPKDTNLMLIGCGGEPVKEAEKITVTNVYDGSGSSFGVLKTNLFTCPIWAKPIFSTSQIDETTKAPLVAGYIGNNEGRVICVIGFDFHDTDFPLSVEFPVLIYKLCNELTNTAPLDENTVETGEEVSIYAKDTDRIEIKYPNGKTVTTETNVLKFADTRTPGIYEIKAGREETILAVNFPVDESEAQVTGSMINASNTEVVVASRTDIYDFTWVFVVLAMIVLGVEWVVYIRQ